MQPVIQAVHPVLPAREVAESAAFFGRLGFQLAFVDDAAAPKYAALTRDGVEIHIQWADHSQWIEGLDRPAFRFLVSDPDALFSEFSAAGVGGAASAASPYAVPADTPWGTREFHLRDPDGSSLQFYRPLDIPA
jgi:catechol 2,3-dioxygenase-like lactoylglutathione lyase family enzyme